VIVGPVLGAWVAVVTAVGTLFAILIHAWYDRHPSDIPIPTEPPRRSPQINFSSTEVAGNIGGLIFRFTRADRSRSSREHLSRGLAGV
jgi:hypothetical protein